MFLAVARQRYYRVRLWDIAEIIPGQCVYIPQTRFLDFHKFSPKKGTQFVGRTNIYFFVVTFIVVSRVMAYLG